MHSVPIRTVIIFVLNLDCRPSGPCALSAAPQAVSITPGKRLKKLGLLPDFTKNLLSSHILGSRDLLFTHADVCQVSFFASSSRHVIAFFYYLLYVV